MNVESLIDTIHTQISIFNKSTKRIHDNYGHDHTMITQDESHKMNLLPTTSVGNDE